MNESDFEIIEHLAVLGRSRLYSLEANIVRGRAEELLDIGLFTIDRHERRVHLAMNSRQVQRLRDLLNSIVIETPAEQTDPADGPRPNYWQEKRMKG